jgi:hypothetical protein
VAVAIPVARILVRGQRSLCALPRRGAPGSRISFCTFSCTAFISISPLRLPSSRTPVIVVVVVAQTGRRLQVHVVVVQAATVAVADTNTDID